MLTIHYTKNKWKHNIYKEYSKHYPSYNSKTNPQNH